MEIAKEDNDVSLKNEIQEIIQNAIATLVTINSSEEFESVSQKIVEEFSTIIPYDEASQKQLAIQLAIQL